MKRELRTAEQLQDKMILQAKIAGVDISCCHCAHRRPWKNGTGHCSKYMTFPYHYRLYAYYKWSDNFEYRNFFNISPRGRIGRRYKICKRWKAGIRQD